MKQAEKIDKIYFAIFGMNGNDGLLKRQEKTETILDALFKKWDEFILTRKNTCPIVLKRKIDAGKIITYILMAGTWVTLMTKLFGWW